MVQQLDERFTLDIVKILISYVEILQLRAKLEAAVVPCSRFI